MKITLLAESLQKKLSYLNHAISTRTDLPILLNILIETEASGIKLSATDLEIGIEITVPAEVVEEGSISVPARSFIELVNSLPNEKLTLFLDKNMLIVESKKTKSSFQTTPASDFPKLYEDKGAMIASVSFVGLKKDASIVVLSSSTDTGRPALSGVLFKKEDEGFLLVGTDGYRLSLKHHTVTGEGSGAKEEMSIIVPAKVVREVLSMKDENQIAIYLSRSSNQIIFEQKDVLLVGRLIEAEFPNYERIIPSDHNSKASFDREALLKAVKICSIFAREAANIITLSLKKDMILVSSQTPSLGENTVEVEAQLVGEENEIAFNARYLLEILSGLTQNEITLEMTGPLNPGVFKIKDDASFLHLIMPIRVQQ